MATLPTDVILEILTKLPIKSLVRFQTISKTWKSLIKSPNFIKRYLNETLISHTNLHLLISIDHSSLHSSELHLSQYQLPFSFSTLCHPLKPKQPFNFVGSYNGVACMTTIDKSVVFLFNPLTKSHRKVPSVNNVVIPKFNMTVFGFGYDGENDDYKVLRIVQGLGKMDDSKNKAHVYSLKSNSWKSVEGIPYYLYYGYYDGVFVNEKLHYVVTKECNSECLFVACFDVRNDSYSLIECPKYDNKFETDSPNSVFTLVELGACLCLLINFYSCHGFSDEIDEFEDNFEDELDARVLECVELWMMEEYGNNDSWVKLFSIRNPQTIGSYKSVKPLVYSGYERRVLLELDNSGFIWYDLNSENVERITAHGLPKGDIRTAGVFVGSLVSLEVEDDHLLPQKETLLRKNINKNVAGDDFLSKGFKLRL